MSGDPRIQELEAEGWTVVRRRTYENLRQELVVHKQLLPLAWLIEKRTVEHRKRWQLARREVLRLQHVETERDTLAEALGRALEHCLGWHGSCCPCNEDWCMEDARAALDRIRDKETTDG